MLKHNHPRFAVEFIDFQSHKLVSSKACACSTKTLQGKPANIALLTAASWGNKREPQNPTSGDGSKIMPTSRKNKKKVRTLVPILSI